LGKRPFSCYEQVDNERKKRYINPEGE